MWRGKQTATPPSVRFLKPLQHLGFTLVEVLLGGFVMLVAVGAILAAYISQVTLNEHARNLSLAMNDATRVMEEIRRRNSPCAGATPDPVIPGGEDAWLQGVGKSVTPNSPAQELVVATAGAVADPQRVTVAVCWRHRNRTIGECAWDGAALSADPDAGGDPAVTESPAMLTTLVTCR